MLVKIGGGNAEQQLVDSCQTSQLDQKIVTVLTDSDVLFGSKLQTGLTSSMHFPGMGQCCSGE